MEDEPREFILCLPKEVICTSGCQMWLKFIDIKAAFGNNYNTCDDCGKVMKVWEGDRI